MIPTPLKWIASILFGLVCGHTSFGFIYPPLSSVTNADSASISAGAMDYAMMGAAILTLLIACAITYFVSRSTSLYQLFGRGCIPLGVALLLSLLVAVLMMDTGNLSGEGGDSSLAPLFFWGLLFGLPFLFSGLALIIGGWVLLRKARTAGQQRNNPPHRA